jgi:predicted AlkP superfamily pyrophosphatase or phosphodiesterase
VLCTLSGLAALSCSDSQAAPAKTPKVLMVGIDGCRPDALVAAGAPALDGLIRDGCISLHAQTCAVTSSGPSWSSLLTGTWPDKHGVHDNSFEGNQFETYPHVFSRIESVRPELFTASFAHWSPIHEHLVSQADISKPAESAAAVREEAVRLLEEGAPDILFLHFDDVDGAGHSKGYSVEVPEYMDAIRQTGREIGLVLDAMRARPSYGEEDWLVLVTTDHGGTDGHGRDIPEHRTIFVIVSGESARRGTILPAPGIVDCAATALAHLGIEPDPSWELDGVPVGLR